MIRNLKIFWLFAMYSVRVTFKSKTGVILFTIGKLLRFGMFFLFAFYLLKNTKILGEYTLEQTIIFYMTYHIVDSLSQLLFREVYRFRPLVISGELTGILLKPYHPFLRILVGGIDILDAVISIIYIIIAAYFMLQIPNIAALQIFIYILFIINALVIATSFHIAVLALGILSTEVDHTIMIYRDLTRMGIFPTDIYRQPIRFIITFIIPIGIMMTIPVKSLFSMLSPTIYLVSFGFSIVMLATSLTMWNMALERYQSWGG